MIPVGLWYVYLCRVPSRDTDTYVLSQCIKNTVFFETKLHLMYSASIIHDELYFAFPIYTPYYSYMPKIPYDSLATMYFYIIQVQCTLRTDCTYQYITLLYVYLQATTNTYVPTKQACIFFPEGRNNLFGQLKYIYIIPSPIKKKLHQILRYGRCDT